MGRIIGAMSVVTQTDAAPGAREDRGLFRRGGQLIGAYIRMHPKPFAAAVTGSMLFAVASIALTTALARATDQVLLPSFSGPVDTDAVWLAVIALVVCGTLRAVGIMIRRYYSGVSGERVMATLRRRVADRYRELELQYHRETPTGELLAHMEADVKAAVDVFWPVPFASGVIALTIFAMIALLLADPWLALVGALLFPSLAIMNRSFAKRVEGPTERAQERIGEVSAVAHESIDGALVVKTLGREDAETARLGRAGRGAARASGSRRARSGPRSRPALDSAPGARQRAPDRDRRVAGLDRRRSRPASWSGSSPCSASCRGRCGSSAGSSPSSRARWSATRGSRRSSRSAPA